MADQKHLIKRQTIELAVQDPAEARRLQNELSRVYRQRIIPLIDRYCTELSRPDRLHRIESLELDLGYVDPGQFETDLVAKLEPALRQALAETIERQEQAAGGRERSPKTASQLELFAFFARTGSLPWWAEATRPQLLEDCLRYLLEAAPAALRRLMRALGRDRQAVRRLVQHYPDEQLAGLGSLLAPALAGSLSGDAQELIGVLSKTGVAAGNGKQPAQLRRSFWTNILQIAAVEGAPAAVEPFYRTVFVRVAADQGLAYHTLISGIRQAIQKEGEKLSLEFKETFARLYQALPGRPGVPEAEQDISRQLVQLEAVLRGVTPRLPPQLQQEWVATLKELAGDAPSSIQMSSESVQRLLRLLQAGLSPPELLPLTLPERRRLLAALQALAESKLFAGELSELAQTLDETVGRETASLPEVAGAFETADAPLDLSFSDADELYLGNAGLVILWPFLSHFFARLGLLAGKQFKEAAARQRAVGLLQHLVTAELAFLEYLLPLNKVLCGLELAEVFEFGPPLSEAEAEECANLLTAVIQQAPILRDMSVDGFRGTFLLRPGVLSSRDGAWLLRVERETYDVVLDRFPWGWEWVKLPWMEAPLRVEW